MPARRLRFLLIMPRLVQTVGDGYVFPLGIAYVSASLKKAGFDVRTLNLNHRDGSIEEILREAIQTQRIDVVATGGLSPQYHMVKHVLDAARRADPRIITVVGGGLISADPETAMTALDQADFGVIGEGEITMCALAAALEAGDDPATVAGLIRRVPGGAERTATRTDIVDIDALPWPDYDGFDIGAYLDAQSAGFGGLNKKRMITMMASRSCPFRCSFCFHTNGQKYRKRTLDDFFAELDDLVRRHRIEYVSLSDELFAPDLDRARAFCARMKTYGIPWAADFRVDRITPELLAILKDGGLDVMFFGLESADDGILKSMRKGITVAQIENALRLSYEAGIAVYGCFIFGDVAETLETAERTLAWWHAHKQYHIHLTLIKPFPGSAIYEHACRTGIIPDRLRYLEDGCPQVNISRLSEAEFGEVVRRIAEAQDTLAGLRDVRLLSVDAALGRETISGTCSHCGRNAVYEHAKLFAIDWLACPHCGQKHAIPCPPELVQRIERNLAQLLAEHGQLAIWGMTQPVLELVRSSPVLADPAVHLIDISSSKQSLVLHGRRVASPAILDSAGITAVVVAVPSHGGQIACQVREHHPSVREIVDICRLVEEPAALAG
jgi:radical SAM superfamily enzyme YgiQ (UPF0313 family)/rRNA maturation protein Nop10